MLHPVQGDLCSGVQGDPPRQRPPRYGKERAVRILLECILVKLSSGCDFTEKANQPLRKPQLTFISLLAIPIKILCLYN